MEISNDCKKSIELINDFFANIKEKQESLLKENELLKQRVKIAEDSVLQFKKETQLEIEKAYKTGYQIANKELASNNPEGGPKLVYSKN